MIVDYKKNGLRVHIDGAFQRFLTNVSVVKREAGDVLIVRGILVESDSSLLWTQASAGDVLSVLIENSDGYERAAKAKLLTLTKGQNLQGKCSFWHARFAL